jgi:hypothetical protein
MKYFVFVRRLIASPNPTAKLKGEPSTLNDYLWTLGGPFSDRDLAERAAMMAIGSPNGLCAEVMTSEQVAAQDMWSTHMDKRDLMERAKRLLPKADVTAAQLRNMEGDRGPQ